METPTLPPSLVHLKKHLDIDHRLTPPAVAPRARFKLTRCLKEEAEFRHHGWIAQRHLVWAAMQKCVKSATRLDAFCECGANCSVQYSPSTATTRLSGSYCHDRLCTPCGKARSSVISRNLQRHCAGKTAWMVTFTIRHGTTPLRDQIKRLYASLVLLRRRQFWKSLIVGGCAVLEVKIGRDGLWHPHIHCLLESGTLDRQRHHRKICDEWHAVTGDSYVVDIRPIQPDQGQVRYVASYTGKPLDASIVRDQSRLIEFIRAIKGVRLVTTFGTWRGIDLGAADPSAPTDWCTVGSLADLIRDAAAGDGYAKCLLYALRTRQPEEVALPPPAA